MGRGRKERKAAERAGRAQRRAILLYSVAALICLAGIGETVYLTVAHLTGETVQCGGSTGCSDVLGSRYAAIGPVPLAAIGSFGYFTAFSCAVFAAFGYLRARLFYAVTVGAMMLTTLWLLYLQAFVVHSFCRYCLVSAAMVFILAALAILQPQKPQPT